MTRDTGFASGSVEEISLAVSEVDPTLSATYVRVVTTELIAEFARVSGDFSPLHLDSDYASKTPFGRSIAHGALMVGFMSAAQTLLSEDIEAAVGHSNVSLGYDRLRFPRPVFAGETITTTIRVVELQPQKLRIVCDVECRNELDQVVAVASHIMRFL
jgi:3-hydroxybutyryl-CoA dehydratase